MDLSEFDELNAFEKIAEERAKATNAFLWQVPAISLAAQAFLLNAAVASGAGQGTRIGVGVLALVAALATAQMLMRHRFRVDVFTHALDASREARGLEPLNHPDLFELVARSRGGPGAEGFRLWDEKRFLAPGRWPAIYVWFVVLMCFAVVDIGVVAAAAV